MTVYNRTVAAAEFLHWLPPSVNEQFEMSNDPNSSPGRRSISSENTIPGYSRTLLGFICGIVFFWLSRLAYDIGFVPPKSVMDTGPIQAPIGWMQPIVNGLFLLGQWPWGLGPLVLFACAAALKRNEENSWVLAFCAGVWLFAVLQQAIFKL